jgi:hypothetical protein
MMQLLAAPSLYAALPLIPRGSAAGGRGGDGAQLVG